MIDATVSIRPAPYVPIIWGRSEDPMFTDMYVAEVVRACARFAGVSVDDLNAPRRDPALCQVRQAGMYFAAKYTRRSLPEIGRRFGGRDHTTVMNARRRVEEDLAGDGEKFGPILAYLQSALGISPARDPDYCAKRAKRGRRGLRR